MKVVCMQSEMQILRFYLVEQQKGIYDLCFWRIATRQTP